MLTRMVNEGSLPISSLDFVFRCTTLDTKDLVVVLPLALLQLELGVLQQLAVLVVAALGPGQEVVKVSLRLILTLKRFCSGFTTNDSFTSLVQMRNNHSLFNS